MFGMGMTLTITDLQEVIGRSRQVFFGVLSQYTIMPILAYGLSIVFNLPPELAVGIILVGSCPGGTASNVIAYLARGDVALSVAMTSASTLLSPIITPLLTFWLAGKWISISAVTLLISILKIVWLPVVAGIVFRRLLGNKLEQVIDTMPLISVSAIVVIVGAVVGVNSNKLIDSFGIAFLVVMLHNVLGLIVGYSLGKLSGMGEPQCRTLSIEVGMQNSGLAVSLALSYFPPLTAIPGAIFSVWHNVSGPLLASYWTDQRS